MALEDEGLFGGWEATDMLGAEARSGESVLKEETLVAERYEPVPFQSGPPPEEDMAGWESTQSDLDSWSQPSQLAAKDDAPVSREDEPLQSEPPPKQTNLSSIGIEGSKLQQQVAKRQHRASGEQAGTMPAVLALPVCPASVQ